MEFTYQTDDLSTAKTSMIVQKMPSLKLSSGIASLRYLWTQLTQGGTETKLLRQNQLNMFSMFKWLYL